jgi:excisionase family DNA binding protein
MSTKKTLGIGQIAHELGCSERTIRRLHAKGELKTFKAGGRTSPIKMTKVDLRKHLNKKG